MAKPVSEEYKAIARYIGRAFGGRYHVREYNHDAEPIAVDILRCDGRPSEGATAYSTIGLSDYSIPWGNDEFPTRIEIACACATDAEAFPNVLASAAFRMMRSGDVYHPGAVIEDYVRLYFADSPLPHLYFTSPFLWPDLRTFNAGSRTVTWLQAMPISEAEHAYLRSHDDLSLENLFNAHRINVFDLNRPSVV